MGLLATIRSRATGRGNYAYATARVRAKKSKLLPEDAYLKMLKMSIPEITHEISETVYQEQVDELASRFSGVDLLESALNVNEEQTYAQVRSIVSGEAEALVLAFLDRYNFRDIKVILRGKHYGATQDEMLKELLIEDRDEYDFLRSLMGDDVQGVSGVLAKLAETGVAGRRYLDALRSAQGEGGEPSLSDYEDALDRSYYAQLLAAVTGDSQAKTLLRHFVEREIDTVNLLTILRLRRAKVAWERADRLIVPGGLDLDAAALRRIYEAPANDDVAAALHDTKFGDKLDAALATGNLPKVEIAARQNLMRFASGFSHMNPLSVLPIIDFLLRKATEVRNLRAIARGKEAKLSEETILETLIL